ncbi:MAG: DinB family protein [Phycisphaerales bacterium]|nr:MAG: DinB family protein [Phycisphaerales bacterium]
MVDAFKELIANQFEAALCTLNTCIEECPPTVWDAPVANLAFCQAVFHALFYTDCYLGPDTESLKQQAFHRENPDFFRDYEELEDRKQQQMYDKESTIKYMASCRRKASEVIAAETAETLSARCGFDWLPFSRAELYVYNIRHIQHHAAQLILRLRLSTDVNIPWARSGWRA